MEEQSAPVIITTTSNIKVWHVALGDDLPVTRTTATLPIPNSSITASQLIWIVIITSLVNIALTHFDIIGPMLEFAYVIACQPSIRKHYKIM